MANLLESHKVAPMELSGKTWKVKVLGGDVQGSSAYYPASVLESQPDIVKPQTRIYLDHPSLDESENRPERSAKDIIGYFKTGSVLEGKDLYAEAEFFSDWREWVKERAEAGVIGMSIRGTGLVEESEDGVPTLQHFNEIMSVDLVTVPGAKGGFEKILEAERKNESKEDTLDKELAEALDSQIKDVAALTEAVKALVAALTVVEEAKPEDKVEEAVEVDIEALIEAGLTKTARARVLAAVKAETPLAEAIKAEKDIAAEILAEAEKAGAFEANLEESKGKESSPIINWG